MKNGSTVYHSLHQPRADPVEQEAQRDHGGGDRGTSDGGGGLYRVQGSNGCTMARISEFCPNYIFSFSPSKRLRYDLIYKNGYNFWV